MIVAFSRGNSQGFELQGTVDAAETRTVLTNTAELLRARGHEAAAELVLRYPFALRNAYNDFLDDFHVLHANLPLKEYEEVRARLGTRDGKEAFRHVAETITEISHFVRFIAVDLSLVAAPTRTAEELARSLTTAEVQWIVRKYIGVNQGYLGDFSYQSHRDFYTELGLDINPDAIVGTTRVRFEKILSEAPLDTQARILDGVLAKYPFASAPNRTNETEAKVRDMIRRLVGASPVANPAPLITSTTVERALADAELLIAQNGATSAVDRSHTALHGYLLRVCADAGISATREDSLAVLLRLIREQHPQFTAGGARASDISAMLKRLGGILDVLNPLRNNASIAHPNEELLDEPEAMLVVNVARSILHYVDRRLR